MIMTSYCPDTSSSFVFNLSSFLAADNNSSSVAADGLIIPMTCEYYSLEGVSDLLLSIRAVREQVNSGLVITGLFSQVLLQTFYKIRRLLMRGRTESLKA